MTFIVKLMSYSSSTIRILFILLLIIAVLAACLILIRANTRDYNFSVNAWFHHNVRSHFTSGKNSISVTELQTTSLLGLILTINEAFVLTFLGMLVILSNIGYALSAWRIKITIRVIGERPKTELAYSPLAEQAFDTFHPETYTIIL